jgi:hypothetical protein
MKKLIAALMTVLFLGSTTGLVLAQTPAAGSAPVVKVSKHKVHKKGKKAMKPVATAVSTTPTSK